MSAVAVTAANISSPGYLRSGVVLNYIAASTVSVGQAVYLNSSNQIAPAIATSAAAANAIGIVVGAANFYGETSIPAGSWAAVCVHGLVEGFTGLVSGQQLYVSKTTAGGLDTAAPATAYDMVVGNAEGSDSIFVRPGSTPPASVA